MKNSDAILFVFLFASALGIEVLTLFWWLGTFGWSYLWILTLLLILLSILFGVLFFRYTFLPLKKRNEELDFLIKETLHELNIPVATIKANASMLKKSCKDAKNQKRIDRIDLATDQLLNLYKEMEYSIKKEIDRVEKEIFRVDELIEQRVQMLENIAQDRKIILQLDSIQIKAPKLGFQKVFDNLIANAVKYSPPKSMIKIRLDQKGLTIEDQGIGIEEKELVKIFERYYQEDAKQEGIGIGLAIVKEYCDANDIPIYIDTKRGHGTKITLELRRVRI